MNKQIISMKLVKDGKQSILTYNDSKAYKELGSVIDTINNRIRVPVNHRIREAFEGLKPHLLIMAGYWNKEDYEDFDFNKGSFKDGLRSASAIAAIGQMQDCSVNYCYRNKGVIAIKGKLRILDSMSSLDIDLKDIKEDYDYEFYSMLQNTVEELFSAIEEWDEKRNEMDKRQMALSFVEIDNSLTAQEAEQMLNNMDEEERTSLVMKQMLKFTTVVDDMEGNEEEEKDEFKTIEVTTPPAKKGKSEKKSEKIPKAKPVHEEEDQFADIDDNVVPML